VRSFILASANQHKAEEFKVLFHHTIDISPAKEALPVEETGKTFFENALLKAKAYFDKFHTPSLSDDSGLVIESFPDLLGVASARFAPETESYSDKCSKILSILEHQVDRKAHFVCVLCFYLSPEEIYFFEGRLQGKIGTQIRGSGGFGYDPIFIPDRQENDGLTLAELPSWKNEFSHRARAVEAALKFFKDSMDKSTI
jgi:XTP/dITP diphosphohydrolase